MVVVNGLYTLGTLTFPAGLCGGAADVEHQPLVGSEHLVLLALHCLLFHSVGNGISWIRGASLAEPANPFFAALWSHVSFTHVWPPLIGLAAACARPDIMRWCRGAYFAWLSECRRPTSIDAAMRAATSVALKLEAPTAASAEVVRLVHVLQIACVPASVQSSSADIIVNGKGAVCVAPRDRALLALHMLRGNHREMFARDVPAIKWVRTVAAPAAFEVAALGDSWLDELEVKP
jgi:hypothetical protein